MISKNNCLNALRKKYKNTNIDIIEGINKVQNSVLTKACVLKGIVKDCSIGPQSTCTDVDVYFDSSPSETFATSTPDQSINEYFDNGVLNGDNVNSTLMPSAILERDKTEEQITNGSEKSISESNSKAWKGNNLGRNKLIGKLIAQIDEERREMLANKINEKVQTIVNKSIEIQRDIDEIKHELELARAEVEIERTQKLLREEEDLANEALHLKYVNEQRCNQRLSEANERIKKALLKQQEVDEQHKQYMKEMKLRLDKVHDYQVVYRTTYQQLQEVTKSCKNSKELFSALSNETAKLRQLNERFEVLVENSKSGQITDQDIVDGASIISKINYILDVFKKEVASVNLKHENTVKSEALKKEEADKKALQEKEARQAVAAAKPDNLPSSDTVDSYVDAESYDRHVKLKRFLEEYEASLQPLINDDSAKKFRFSCQRAVNIPVNAISPCSREHMQDKYLKLSKLLKGQPVVVSNATISASSHPLGIKFCTNLLAKKFVNQGEHTVSSKPEAAFAIAGIIVSLWHEFPDFGKLLLAHFQMECPYLIPAFMPQVEGQSNEDYYRVLGYNYIDGKVESQDKFLKRMSGVMRLYAAIIITHSHLSSVTHPLGLREAWRWLAATLNLEPRADISATLILDMLEVTGFEMTVHYTVQFRKMLLLLCTDFFRRIEQVTPDGCGGPVGRLKTFLEKTLKEGNIPPPTGILTRSVW